MIEITFEILIIVLPIDDEFIHIINAVRIQNSHSELVIHKRSIYFTDPPTQPFYTASIPSP